MSTDPALIALDAAGVTTLTVAAVLAGCEGYLKLHFDEKSHTAIVATDPFPVNSFMLAKKLVDQAGAAVHGNMAMTANWTKLVERLENIIDVSIEASLCKEIDLAKVANELQTELVRGALDLKAITRSFTLKGLSVGKKPDEIAYEMHQLVLAYCMAGNSNARLSKVKQAEIVQIISIYGVKGQPKGLDISAGRLTICLLEFYGFLLATGKIKGVGAARPYAWPAVLCGLMSAGIIPQSMPDLQAVYLLWLAKASRIFPKFNEAKTIGIAKGAYANPVVPETARKKILWLSYNDMDAKEQAEFKAKFPKIIDCDVSPGTKRLEHLNSEKVGVKQSFPANDVPLWITDASGKSVFNPAVDVMYPAYVAPVGTPDAANQGNLLTTINSLIANFQAGKP